MVRIFRKIWKVLSSRYFICSLLIIIEVILLFHIEKYLMDYSFGIRICSYVISFLTLIYVVNLDMSVEGKLPWILVILLLQPFGALLFIIFGIRLITHQEKRFFKKLYSNYKEFFKPDSTYLNDLKNDNLLAYQKAHSLSNDSHASVYKNTKSYYYESGESFFKDYLNDLKNAEKFIFIEYFIVSKGEMLNQIIDILKKKSQEGVVVRFLYDDIGSIFNIDSDFDKQLTKLGINTLCFGKYTGKANSSHNNRNHRKMTIIDGVVCYTGGINIADEYINRKVKYGYWKDSAIKLVGDAAYEFTKLFLFDWDLTANKTSNWNDYLIKYENNTYDGCYIPFGTGPKPLYNANIAKNTYLNLINQATKYIYITTPYLIIDKELTNALVNASKRGVDVRIILPHIPDKKFVYAITKSSYLNLIKSGIKIFEFEKGFIHAKNFICDDDYAVCGTINFDYRSLIHHYENAVWMYKSNTINLMKEDFIKTIDESLIITKEDATLNIFTRLFVGIIYIFSPLF